MRCFRLKIDQLKIRINFRNSWCLLLITAVLAVINKTIRLPRLAQRLSTALPVCALFPVGKSTNSEDSLSGEPGERKSNQFKNFLVCKHNKHVYHDAPFSAKALFMSFYENAIEKLYSRTTQGIISTPRRFPLEDLRTTVSLRSPHQ